jgi:hypothetical protein
MSSGGAFPLAYLRIVRREVSSFGLRNNDEGYEMRGPSFY